MITGLLQYQRKNVFSTNAFLCYAFFFFAAALKGTLQGAGIWKHGGRGQGRRGGGGCMLMSARKN